jgi:biotin carboxyl carrier protein
MKMETSITANSKGKVGEIIFQSGTLMKTCDLIVETNY